MSRSSSSILAFAALLGTATAAGGWLALRGDGFDADAWRREAGNHSGPNARSNKATALGSRLPPGTPRAAVRALLGDPDFSDELQDVYSLGRSTMGPHFESQAITYDAAGRIAAMERRRM